jgi:threonine dehydrogenase-like Zn-dependent dehydrogenase
MKGVVFLGDRKLELREFPDPTPGPRDVILEIRASGMCGTDLHNYRAPANPGGVVTGGIKRAAGVIAGHEPCGVVAAVGTAVTDKDARIGQRVMDHHYDGCGNCKPCRAGCGDVSGPDTKEPASSRGRFSLLGSVVGADFSQVIPRTKSARTPRRPRRSRTIGAAFSV